MMYGHVETPRQRVELGRDVGAARLAERLLALGVENAHERHAHAAAVGLAREHAGQPRLLACRALKKFLCLHCQIGSWQHLTHLPLSFLPACAHYAKFFKKSEKKD